MSIRILRGWFPIRRDLDRPRALFLATLSFLLPFGIWCAFSYIPSLWHPDIKLQITAEREGIATVFVAGDHVSHEFFASYSGDVRSENEALLAARADGSALGGQRRANQRILRQLAPLAIANGWLTHTDSQNDAAIYHFWRDLATEERTSTNPILTPENLGIIKENWAKLSEKSPDFIFRKLPDEPLLKLVPQGRPANPVYLPAPHEVFRAGLRDFTAEPRSEGGATMFTRYQSSLRIVFSGFLWACIIGIPLGVLCGVFDFFSKLIEPFVDFFRYMPAPTFSTLLVAVLLANDAPKIALVFIGTVFQMVLVVAKTTRLLDTSLLEAGQTLGAKPAQLVRHIVIPGVLPNLYNDLRILLGWAWTWLVIAELIGVKSGLTEFIETQGRYRNFDRVYPVIILIGVTGFVTDQFLSWLHGLLFPWAAKSSRLSRGIASVVTKPFHIIAESARDRIAANEAAYSSRNSNQP